MIFLILEPHQFSWYALDAPGSAVEEGNTITITSSTNTSTSTTTSTITLVSVATEDEGDEYYCSTEFSDGTTVNSTSASITEVIGKQAI